MIIHMQYNIHTHNSVYWDYTSSVTNYFPLNGLGGAVHCTTKYVGRLSVAMRSSGTAAGMEERAVQ